MRSQVRFFKLRTKFSANNLEYLLSCNHEKIYFTIKPFILSVSAFFFAINFATADEDTLLLSYFSAPNLAT